MIDNLKCNICKHNYNIDNRKPMVLPCGHTLCLRCIEQMWEKTGSIKCHNDNKKFFLHRDNILINPFILNMLSNVKNKYVNNELIEVLQI